MIFLNDNQPIVTFPTSTKDYVLNIYNYNNSLVAIVEDINFYQLFEMIEYFSVPAIYFDWCFSVYWPAPLWSVYGKPMKNKLYFELLYETSMRTGLPILTKQKMKRGF